MNYLLRFFCAGGNLRFGHSKIGMKGVIEKTSRLTFATFFIFFTKRYSIGDDTPVGVKVFLSGNSISLVLNL